MIKEKKYRKVNFLTSELSEFVDCFPPPLLVLCQHMPPFWVNVIVA